jgi:hypothetical protein
MKEVGIFTAPEPGILWIYISTLKEPGLIEKKHIL